MAVYVGKQQMELFGGIKKVISGDAEEYTGDYLVQPSATDMQTLETKGKLMTDDVTIFKINKYEVSNDKGGTTVYIGGGQ